MKLVLIFGPQAVGKMTVGQELVKRTHLKLFHNHMTIDLLAPLFEFNSEMWRLSTLFRMEIFKSFAKSGQYGLIFTYVWALDEKEDWDAVEKMCEIFREVSADLFFVELEADVKERLLRNETPNRLEHKPTKRNITQSKEDLLRTMEKHRLNSLEGEIRELNYLKINNSHLSPEETAELIKRTFQL